MGKKKMFPLSADNTIVYTGHLRKLLESADKLLVLMSLAMLLYTGAT